VLRKLEDERPRQPEPAELEALRTRIGELEAAVRTNGTRRATAKPKARADR
jgi:hypothetical protein